MADKVELEVVVPGVEKSINSVKGLKDAIKDARNEQLKAASAFGEGSKEYQEATSRLSELKDKMDDLNDSTKSLQGTGVEKLTQGFGFLKDGLANFDFDKIKVGFKGIGSAMSAIPILLVIEGIKLLIENFDTVVEFVQKFTGSVNESKKAVETLTQTVEAESVVNKKLIAQYDDSIRLLEAQGASETKITEEKKKKLKVEIAELESQLRLRAAKINDVLVNDDVSDSITRISIATAKKLGLDKIAAEGEKQLAKDKKERYKEDLEAFNQLTIDINAARTSIQVLDAQLNKKEVDAWKQKNKERLDDERDTWQKTLEIRLANNEAAAQQDIKDKEAKAAEQLAEQEAWMTEAQAQTEAEIGMNKSAIDTTFDYRKAKREEDTQNFLSNLDQQQQATEAALAATQALTDLYFAYQLKKNKGNAAAELEIRKKQFNVNKAFGIVNSVVDGIGAVQKALNNPYPLNIVLAVASGILATANTVKIASQKFDAGSASSGGGGGSASIPIPSPPTVSTQQADVAGAKFDENGKNIKEESAQSSQTVNVNVKAQVVETEMTQKQQDVKTIKDQSTF